MFRILCAGLFAASVLFVAACEKKTQPTEFKGKNGHDHDHDRKDAMLEDIDVMGKKIHAGLTAHLSAQEGNDLDVFFETMDKEPKAVPIPITASVTARVTREGDPNAQLITFEPAEKDERKGDPDGMCSRFAAKTPWMKPDDKLTVVLSVEIDKTLKKVTFKDFVPKDKIHKH